jgi:hypothetical protein
VHFFFLFNFFLNIEREKKRRREGGREKEKKRMWRDVVIFLIKHRVLLLTCSDYASRAWTLYTYAQFAWLLWVRLQMRLRRCSLSTDYMLVGEGGEEVEVVEKAE